MNSPKALKMADDLDTLCDPYDSAIAAELRRLHEAHEWQHRMAGERLRRIEKLERIQAELVEALNDLAAWGDGDVGGHMDEPHAAKVSRAALAKVEAA